MKQGRPPPSFVAAVLVVCACVGVPVRQTPKGSAPPVVPVSRLERQVADLLLQARREWLEFGSCSSKILSRCGAERPLLMLLESNLLWSSAAYFSPAGDKVASRGCLGDSPSGLVPTCSPHEGPVLRDLCAEALEGLERRGVTVQATCLCNAAKRDLPLGRSTVELLADEGQLTLTVEVPRSLEQQISVHVLRLASDIVLRQCDVTAAPSAHQAFDAEHGFGIEGFRV
jgi:hypothetical protein